MTFELHLNEFIDSKIYYYGCFEQDTTKVIYNIVQTVMIVIDILASIVAHTLSIAKLVGKN